MSDQSRRDFLKKAGATAASASTFAALSNSASGAGGGDRPNIIFIMTDDHDRQALSCYGSDINETPNLDRVAEEGMTFNHCMVTNSICEPSRATILTGKYGHKNGVLDNGTKFDGSQQTFPKLLQRAGYQTAMIGKWHLKSEPTGFDYWNVLPGQGNYYNPEFIEMGNRKQYEGHCTDVTTDRCLEWLQNRDSNSPFCLMFHHKAPHRPWRPALRHLDLYKDEKIPEPDTLFDDYESRSAAAYEQELSIKNIMDERDLKITKQPRLTDEQRRRWREAYAQRRKEWKNKDLEGKDLVRWKYQAYMQDYLRCIAGVDESIGRLLDYLEKSGLEDNTMVVYTSDQGFFLGNHGWFDKRFMYEEPLHMPFMVRFPGEVEAGSRTDDMVLNLDFAPTFLDAAGCDVPGDMQGRSFMPILKGDTPDDWRTSMYYHYYEYPAVHSVKRHYGVRTQRYKLIHFYFDQEAWEMYDLKRDPNETNNVVAQPEYQDVRRRLEKELKRLRNKYGESEKTDWQHVREYL